MKGKMLELKNILVPVDASAGAEAALQLGLYLGEKHGAAVRLLHVADSLDEARVFESEYLERLGSSLQSKAKTELISVAESRPADTIMKMSRRIDADIVLMGKHGARTTDKLLTYLGGYGQVIGSTAEYVLRTSQRPVVLASPRFVHGPVDVRRILVAIDFSTYTPAALRLGRELGALFGAEVEYLHVLETSDAEGRSSNAMHSEESLVGEHLAIERGPADRVILEHIRRRNADLLAIHSHGNTGDRRARIGHVAEKVVQSAPCSVLTVKSFGKSPVRPDQADRDLADKMLQQAAMA